MPDTTDLVMDLAKRRGFLWPSFEVYGGAAGFYDYGPLGAAMKRRFEQLWRRVFVDEESTPMAEIFCPRVTPEPVLVASGHVGEFTDLLVKCQACQTPLRADHLVAAAGYEGNAGALKAQEVDAELASRKPKCPNCGKAAGFSPAVRQNLMNQTEIGPGSGRVGYLRPETAQGIFTDFPALRRHFREKLPFGVVQLGGSNRNEISPRQGMLRLREFSMMECEVFYDPAAKTHPRFSEVAGRTATFVPNTDETARTASFGDAVASGMVANEALAYWLARTQEFLVAAGMDPKRLHFRQHLKDEMAHYAADCWDAEFHSDRYGWVECVGIADRGSYDLTQHALHSGTTVKHPVTGEDVRRPNGEFLRQVQPPGKPVGFTATAWAPSKRFFPTLKQKAKAAEYVMAQSSPLAMACRRHGIEPRHFLWRDDEWQLQEQEVSRRPATQPLTLTIGEGTPHAQTIEVPAEAYELVETKVTVVGRRYAPNVIEPSFGVDRILYALWEHAYERTQKEGEEYVRLRLSPNVAPIQAAVLPLTGKDGLPELAKRVEWDLRKAGLLVDYDETGSIGRRYARQDEVGTPFCITVDDKTPADGAVTVRERDSTQQDRVPLARLVEDLRLRLAPPVLAGSGA
ncbi:MAG TPA: glycine--tRNA ligase [Candidatus Thermoplasmatota archaeon]|nr:glycine--tRNA ligase [Candidatus Thermoplasmatota archaeon]